MLKKLIAIAISVMVAALAVFPVATLADDAVTLDLTAPLDGFTQSELAASYSASSPYQKGGFKAPTISGLGAKLFKDDGIGDYVRVEYTAEASATPNGGASLTDSDLNVQGSGDNSVMTFDVTLRRNTNKHIYFYLLTESGSRETVMLWWNTDSLNRLWWGNSKHNTELALADNTWYNFKFTLDLNNKLYKLTLDGGNFDNVTHTCDSAKYAIPADVTYEGFGIGYLRPVAKGDSFDIADAKLKNYGSVAYNEKLTFENGTFASSAGSKWTNGSWSADAVSSITRTKTSVGTHESAMKLSQSSASTMTIVNTIPAGTVGSDGKLVVEASYYEHLFGQIRITIGGVDAGGAAKSLVVLGYSGANWNYSFCGASAKSMPKAEDEWRCVRAVLDLKNDKATMNTWREANIDDTSKQTSDEDSSVLAGFADITSVTFTVWPRWAPDRYMCIDDFRVYEADELIFEGSNPINGTVGSINITDALTAEFNMPLADSTLTNVTMTIKDSQGSTVSGTKTLNAKKTGIMFKPASPLNVEETYTLSISGTVTDIFGQVLAIDKEITFSTPKLFKLNNCIFSQGGVETESVADVEAGELSADVKITINGGEPEQVAVLLGLYEKESQSFIAGDVAYTDHLTEIEHTLTVTVPDDGYTYYPAVYVWNSLDKPGAYIDSIVLE
ncbi:MAG: hypothetical protein E7395_04770 [Ruminococcaceae bacterium]|nr:hypothetical protein [Oscillospiraceae bacterium]